MCKMNEDLYSAIENAFSDAYCNDGKLEVAKLYAEIRLRADALLKDYIEIEESCDEIT